MSRKVFAVLATLVLGSALLVPGTSPARVSAATGEQWVAGWGRPATGGGSGRTNASVRNIARMTIGGSAIRIRLSNTSTQPMTIGSAFVALQLGTVGPAVVPGTTKRVTFDGGKNGTTIAGGAIAHYSDPVAFAVQPQQHLVISLFLPDAAPPAGTSQWSSSYATPNGAGDQSADESGLLYSIVVPLSTYALTGVDVLTADADGAVVALGSSTFQGFDATPDGYDDFLTLLSARINTELPPGRRKGLVNAGIGGDTLRASIQQRLDRDVFSHTRIVGVMVFNVNDLGQGRSALQIAQDYMTLIGLSRPRGIKVLCPTWPPAAQSLSSAAERALLNGWLMNSRNCDGVVDWDAVVRWESGPNRNVYHPQYQGDSIHMNRFGHQAIANSVPMGWFTDRWHFGPQPGDPPIVVPELVVTSEAITASGEKETTTVSAVVRNVGDAGATNVVVRFFVDGEPLGDSAIASIAVDGSGTATVTWNLKSVTGDHVISVAVDPNGAISEGRRDNNSASRTFTVSGNRVVN